MACDWKRNEHMPEEMFCDEFHLVDLRVYENCKKVRPCCILSLPWPLTVVRQLEEMAAGELLALVIVRHRPSEHLQA